MTLGNDKKQSAAVNSHSLPLYALSSHPPNRFDEETNASFGAASAPRFDDNVAGVEQRVQARAA
jgi:hypothetical protein